MASSSTPSLSGLVSSAYASIEEMIATEAANNTIDCVQLDALVVMKVIKHCKDYLPDIVTGQLLGLSVGGTLEVTNAYPFPNRQQDDDDENQAAGSASAGTIAEESGAEYQIEMMRCLREVNVDNNTVGWYTSTYLGSFLNEALIETQYNYQTTIRKCVVLIYDPLRTAQGSLSLKAYRLSAAFMDLYAKHGASGFTKEALDAHGGLSFQSIFEQVPVRVHNSHLVQALLYDLEDNEPSLSLDSHFDRLDLSINPFLEKNLESLLDSLDSLTQEQNKQQYFMKTLARQQAQQSAFVARKRAETGAEDRAIIAEEEQNGNPMFKVPTQPSRLEPLLVTNQINNYCEQINSFAGSAFTKLFLFGALQK